VADIGGGEGVCNNNSSNTFPLGRFSRAAILISRMSRLESRCWDHFDCNGGSMRVWCGLWLKLTPDFMVLNGRYHFPARDLVNLTFQIFPNSEVSRTRIVVMLSLSALVREAMDWRQLEMMKFVCWKVLMGMSFRGSKSTYYIKSVSWMD